MAQNSWPFENIDTNETQFSQWARNIGEGVKTGALNELEVFADSTGMQVKVRSGQALVRGHYYQNTAEVTLTLDAADATNPRIDTVVLELDPSANSIVLKVITGTAESSPSAEPVVQTDAGIYQIKLANIAVGAGVTTITAGNVTDTRFYIEDFSGTVPGSSITGEITTATMDGDRLFNQIDSATIPGANVTGLTLSHVTDVTATATEVNYTDGVTSPIQSQLDSKQNDVITTEGDLVIGDGTGAASRIAIGNSNQVLTSNGSTATWQDLASGGGITELTTTNLSGNLNVTVSNINQSYKHLIIRLENVGVDGSGFTPAFRPNQVGNVTVAKFIDRAGNVIDGNDRFWSAWDFGGNNYVTIIIYDYADTQGYQALQGLGYYVSNGNPVPIIGSAVRNTTGAINSIEFRSSNGWNSGSVTIWGVE